MTTSEVLSSLKGLSVLVTGGASGLGYATVERLSKLGCIVAIIDLNEPKILPNNSYYIKADVTSEPDMMKALDIIEKKAKKLDVLVNSAGIVYDHPVFKVETKTPYPLHEFERLLKVNTTGTFNASRLCCLLFYKNQPNQSQQRGVIINTSSVAAYEGPCSFTGYGASEAAIVGMTLPMARDLASIGVRVVTIVAGSFPTPFVQFLPQNILDSIAAATPFPRRLGHPDEYAHMVQSIIENPMINGESIRLDGAFRCGAQL